MFIEYTFRMPRSKIPRLQQRARAALLPRLIKIIANDPALLTLLAQAATLQHRELLLASLRAVMTAWPDDMENTYPDTMESNNALFSALIDWISNHRTESQLVEAVTTYQRERDLNPKIHRFVVERLGLDRASGRAWVNSLPKHHLRRLASPYPPLGEHVVESPEIDSLWRAHFETGPQADTRQARRPLHRLQSEKLTLTVPGEESCVLVDADDGSIIAVVLRGIAGDAEEDGGAQAFLQWAGQTINDGITGRRSVRVSRDAHLPLHVLIYVCRKRIQGKWFRLGTLQARARTHRSAGFATCSAAAS